jgi:hypothetical protein
MLAGEGRRRLMLDKTKDETERFYASSELLGMRTRVRFATEAERDEYVKNEKQAEEKRSSRRASAVEGLDAFCDERAINAYSGCMILFGSHERPRVFIEDATSMPPDVFWRVFVRQWSGFDFIPHRKIRKLFIKNRHAWAGVFANGYTAHDDDGDVIYSTRLDLLEERFTVYRGQDAGDPCDGLAWTLDRDIALRFARGCRRRNPTPIVLEAWVRRADVACYFGPDGGTKIGDRGEDEVVLFKAPSLSKCVVKLLDAEDRERLEQGDRDRAAKWAELEKTIRERGKA